ncbi:hypothetical protein KEM48_014185 [Puccinia striiformis f. sp. tritici PST-130]|nr:hypothetical protein KEM48_014185 [Puccinia striiformis f. sp. tritici PST-130]
MCWNSKLLQLLSFSHWLYSLCTNKTKVRWRRTHFKRLPNPTTPKSCYNCVVKNDSTLLVIKSASIVCGQSGHISKDCLIPVA